MVGSTHASVLIRGEAGRPSRFTTIFRFAQTSPVALGSLALLVLIILVAIFAPVIAPYDPLAGDYTAIRQPPTSAHLMGTDDIGRDVLSRIIYGARTSLIVGFGAVLIGDTIGLVTGILSGYAGGRADLFGQRLLEVLLAFPGLILATLFVVALGTGLQTVIVAIAITRIPASNRVVRAVTLSIKHLDFVEAARVSGATPWRVMLWHIAPQTIAPFLVVVSLHLGISIIAEAALSFLGIGIPPPDPSWGTMIGGAISSQFNPPWWLAIFPGLAIAITVFSVNLVGDTLRDILDPNLRGRTERA
jgi:ABC-type dipeptide/oligopeptide/nickel transport system permease subunit